MPTRVLLVSHVISTRFQVMFKAQKLRRLNKDIDLGPICRITGKYECFDNSAPWPRIFFSFCSMLCCCKGGSASWKNAEPTGRETSENERTAGGGTVHRGPCPRDRKDNLQKCSGPDPGGGQGKAERSHRNGKGY